MNTGDKIIKLRKEKNLSQEKLADKLGIARQTLSSWESNITTPDLNQIRKIAEIFNISADELIDNNIKLVIQKVNNTETLAKKQMKFIKIILITLYFILMIAIIGFIVYMINKKDYTNYYQPEFTCYVNDKQYQFYLSTDEEGNSVIVSYMPHIKSTEEYAAGDSVYEMFSSLNALKKVIISNGGKCK